jgi:hypothetical protein
MPGIDFARLRREITMEDVLHPRRAHCASTVWGLVKRGRIR